MKKEKGITLIALVITIIVLLILAGISISLTLGDNGILKKGIEAKEKTMNATLVEQIKLEQVAYEVEKNTDSTTESLMDYLLNKQYISEISGEEKVYKINVAKLLGSNQAIGKGNATATEKNDVYILEDLSENNEIKYNIKYYKNNSNIKDIYGEGFETSKNDENNQTPINNKYTAHLKVRSDETPRVLEDNGISIREENTEETNQIIEALSPLDELPNDITKSEYVEEGAEIVEAVSFYVQDVCPNGDYEITILFDTAFEKNSYDNEFVVIGVPIEEDIAYHVFSADGTEDGSIKFTIPSSLIQTIRGKDVVLMVGV